MSSHAPTEAESLVTVPHSVSVAQERKEPMEPQPQPVPVQPMPESPTNRLGQVVRMFYEPSAVFRELAHRPSWVWPVLILVVFSLASQLVIAPRIDMEGTIREQMAKSGRPVTEEQLEQAVAVGGKFAKLTMYTTPLMIPIMFLILAGLYTLGLRLVGGDTAFGKVFSGISHALLPPSLVSGALMLVVALQRDSLLASEFPHLVKSSVASWLGPDAHRVLVAAGSVLDVFNLWQWVLVVLALQIIGKVKRGQAIGIVVVLWGLYTLGKVGLALLF